MISNIWPCYSLIISPLSTICQAQKLYVPNDRLIYMLYSNATYLRGAKIFIWNVKYLYYVCTGKSLSEALIFASTNPQYDDRLFNTWKFQAQTWGEHVVYINCFWHAEQFLYTTCSPNVLQKEELLTKIYLWHVFQSPIVKL